MLEDTNSLDGAHTVIRLLRPWLKFEAYYELNKTGARLQISIDNM